MRPREHIRYVIFGSSTGNFFWESCAKSLGSKWTSICLTRIARSSLDILPFNVERFHYLSSTLKGAYHLDGLDFCYILDYISFIRRK